MKRRLSASAYSYIVVIVIALIVVASGLSMRYYQSKLLPLVLGTSILFFATAGVWRDIRLQARSATTVTEAGKGREQEASGRRYWLAVAWVAGFLLAIYLLGFLVSMPLYILSYMKVHRIRWLTSVACAILTTAIIYLGFQTLLGIELYPGLLFTWLRQ